MSENDRIAKKNAAKGRDRSSLMTEGTKIKGRMKVS